MDFDVMEAQYVSGHTVWLRFRDGTAGHWPNGADLAPEFLHDGVKAAA
jgi:hypothetical protein